MESLKNHPTYLTPSKASLFDSSPYGFIKKYILKEKPEDTEAMKKGTDLHELFYLLLTDYTNQKHILDFNEIKEMPAKWPTKKECGKTIAEQREEWLKMCEDKGYTVLSPQIKDVGMSMLRFIRHSSILRRIKHSSWSCEDTLIDHKLKIGGIMDLWLPDFNTIIDIKTTSKDQQSFGRYDEAKLAIQQAMYCKLAQTVRKVKNPKFAFLVVQTKWPYECWLTQLPPRYVDLVSVHLPEIIRRYQNFLGSIQECVDDAFGQKKDVEKTLDTLKQFKVYRPDEMREVDVRPWSYQDFERTWNPMKRKK